MDIGGVGKGRAELSIFIPSVFDFGVFLLTSLETIGLEFIFFFLLT